MNISDNSQGGSLNHTDAFAAFHEDRARARAEAIKVTWRKVSEMTGGGWSGLGPAGALVYVTRNAKTGIYAYGRRNGVVMKFAGSAATLVAAKRAAEALFKCSKCGMAAHEPDRFCTTTHNAPQAQKEATMAPTATTPAVPSIDIFDGLSYVANEKKEGFGRLCLDKLTVAYVNPRKDGFQLDFSAKLVEGAPKKFEASLRGINAHGGRVVMKVDAGSAKTAKALVEWIVKKNS